MRHTATPLDSAHAPPSGRSRGLVQHVVDGLTASFVEGTLAPGTKLPTEAEIMSQFGVSRTVIREAISRLQANSLVETRHGIGTFALMVPKPNSFQLAEVDHEMLSDVLSMLELRVSLETEAAGLAAQRRTPEALDAMQSHLHAFQQCIGQGVSPVPSDFNFHMEVVKATGNPHFLDLMTYLGNTVILRSMIDTTIEAPKGDLRSVWKVLDEHENIFNAIRNQDSDSARAAMRTHLSNSKDRLKKSHANSNFAGP